MKVHYYLVLVLLSILIMNMWRSTVVEGMHGFTPVYSSPAGSALDYSLVDRSPQKPTGPKEQPNPLSYNKVIEPICEGGFVLTGFPYTMQ
jgi:hypothetical protein